MTTLKYYYNLLSQPSRAVYIFLKLTNVPFEGCKVDLQSGEHLTEDFKENYSRFQKIPFIHDGNFRLTESIAIVRYLVNKYGIVSNLYPGGGNHLQQQAHIDEYLEWQHLNTRAHNAYYFQQKFLMPLITGKPPNEKVIAKSMRNVNNCLDQIETLWLRDNQFICGQEVTIADIFAACEIEQPRLADFEPRTNRPKLTAWLDRVRDATNPYYDEAHKVLNKILAQKMDSKL